MAKPTRFTQDMIEEYVSLGYWEQTSMADVYDQNARDHPEREALADSSVRLTWSQIKTMSDRVALGLLELGLQRDDAVLVQLPNWMENWILRLALAKAGLLRCLTPMTFRHTEMKLVLCKLAAVAVVIPREEEGFNYFGMLQEIRPNLPALKYVLVVNDDVPPGAISIREMFQTPLQQKYASGYLQRTKFSALEVSAIHPSSGTTGLPKLGEFPDCVFKLVGRNLIQRMRLTGKDVCGVCGPMYGGAGMLIWYTAPQIAARTVLFQSFEVEDVFHLIERERITFLSTVPAILARMVRYPHLDKYDLSSLRVIRTGTAPLFPEIAAEAEQKLGCFVIPAAGSTEALFSHASVDQSPEERYSTTGKPMWGNEIKVVDDEGKEVPQGEAGELLVRGACTSSGYYGDIDATLQVWGELGREGWGRSGDLVRLDEHGNVIFVGRKKDMILRGGQNIYPAEIEALLSQHPKVAGVSIVAMPDLEMGERACAYVIPKARQQLTFEEMISFLKEKKIAPYKLPERLELIQEFPTSGDGFKVSKRALVADITQKLKAEGRT